MKNNADMTPQEITEIIRKRFDKAQAATMVARRADNCIELGNWLVEARDMADAANEPVQAQKIIKAFDKVLMAIGYAIREDDSAYSARLVEARLLMAQVGNAVPNNQDAMGSC